MATTESKLVQDLLHKKEKKESEPNKLLDDLQQKNIDTVNTDNLEELLSKTTNLSTAEFVKKYHSASKETKAILDNYINNLVSNLL